MIGRTGTRAQARRSADDGNHVGLRAHRRWSWGVIALVCTLATGCGGGGAKSASSSVTTASTEVTTSTTASLGARSVVDDADRRLAQVDSQLSALDAAPTSEEDLGR